MNKLSFILISLTVLIHNIEAQVTKASPEEFKILKSRPLIVELAEQDKNKAEQLIHDICEKLLANMVIEDFKFELV